MAGRTCRGGVRSVDRAGSIAGARLRQHAAGRHPPELRHAARPGRRQRGAADRVAALPGGRVAASRRRAAAVQLRLVRAGARRLCAAAARPAGRAPAAHHQHEHHRRRPAARSLARIRAEDRSGGGLQQQPGGGGAAEPQGGAGFRARGPVHRGARTFHDRHRRHGGLRAAGDHAARTPGCAHRLWSHLRADQRAGDRAAGPGQAEHADLPRAGAAHGLRRALFCRRRRDAGSRCAEARMGGLRPAARQGLGQAGTARCALRRRRLPHARRQSVGRRAGPGRARLPAQLRKRGLGAGAGGTLSAGDDLAAGAQLPQLHLRQRAKPARHRPTATGTAGPTPASTRST